MTDEFELDDMGRLPPRPAQPARPRSQMFEEPLHISSGGGGGEDYGGGMGGFGGDYGGGGDMGGFGGPAAPDMGFGGGGGAMGFGDPSQPMLGPGGGGMMGQPLGGGMMGGGGLAQPDENEWRRRRNARFNRCVLDLWFCVVLLLLFVSFIMGAIILYQLFELSNDLHTKYEIDVPKELPQNFPNWPHENFQMAD